MPDSCQEEVWNPAEKSRYCLVGRFLRGRPLLPVVREFARKNWRTKGDLSITLLDPRHVFIKFSNKEDMHKKKTKRSFWLRDWCLGFSAGAMISVSGMVIQCMRLFGYRDPHPPIVFFFEFRLFSIVSTFGIGLTLDGPTKLVSRSNVAREK